MSVRVDEFKTRVKGHLGTLGSGYRKNVLYALARQTVKEARATSSDTIDRTHISRAKAAFLAVNKAVRSDLWANEKGNEQLREKQTKTNSTLITAASTLERLVIGDLG